MYKYSFLVYHKEYSGFLKELQQLGVLHIIEKEAEKDDQIKEKILQIKRLNDTIKFLGKRKPESAGKQTTANGIKIVEEIRQKQNKLEQLFHDLKLAQKELNNVSPWGDFSAESIAGLNAENIYVKFYISSTRSFNNEWLDEYNVEIINKIGNQIYFIIIQQGNKDLHIKAEEVIQPKKPISEIKQKIDWIEGEIVQINNELDNYAAYAIPLLQQEKEELTSHLVFEKAILNTADEADNKMKVLEGWVPKSQKKQLDSVLNESHILFHFEKPSTKDKVPVLLENNRFGKLFEPIGELFSLPSYQELDLTVFFAPFFMLFFGFCLGDAGYGLLFIIGAGLYKLKADKKLRPLLSLVQILGVGTVIFGIVSGTFFGVNLIETDIKFLENYKSLFLNPENMFNLALVLGALQIVFAMVIKAINQIRQFGFSHSLATFGWLTIILGSGLYLALTKYALINENNLILYTILGLGGFLIVFFSDVEIGIPARIGKGVWNIYSTITGMFGDLLSYIRLFALGLSSAILGFVINDIAMQILGSAPIIGPIFFVLFLLIGHGLNILISSLGSFVHPMRLTFVEFYKNAGFAGGGKEYNPFTHKIKVK